MEAQKTPVLIRVRVTVYQRCVFLALQAGCESIPEIRCWLRSVGWNTSALWALSIRGALADLKRAGLR